MHTQGPLTYVSTWHADSASFLALIHRARWAVGQFGVQLTYVKHSPGGDAHIGRTLALLDPQSEQFGTLPPHFSYVDVSESAVQEAIETVFGTVVENMHSLMPFLLASLVYHRDYLRANLPADHPFWTSGFARIDAQQLSADVSLENRGDKVQLKAMGVPLCVRLLERQHAFESALIGKLEALADESSDTKEGLRNIASLIPQSELSQQWSVGRERADEWGKHLITLIEPSMEAALAKVISPELVATLTQGAMRDPGASAAAAAPEDM